MDIETWQGIKVESLENFVKIEIGITNCKILILHKKKKHLIEFFKIIKYLLKINKRNAVNALKSNYYNL